jgi:hypothetical protein
MPPWKLVRVPVAGVLLMGLEQPVYKGLVGNFLVRRLAI